MHFAKMKLISFVLIKQVQCFSHMRDSKPKKEIKYNDFSLISLWIWIQQMNFNLLGKAVGD